MPHKFIETISLDTQVFEAAGFSYERKTFQALKSHFAAGRLKLVMSDVTVREVHSRIRKRVAEEALLQRQLCNKIKILHNSSVPEVKSAISKFDEKVAADDLCAQFDHFVAECGAEIIDSSSLSADSVLHKYFAGEPPFGNSETKKHELPDAFAIQALSEWAENNELEMLVVSDDKLFREGCGAVSRLIPKTTLGEVLDHVASDDEQLATFLRKETLASIKLIEQQATEEFEGLYFWVEDENGEAEVHLTNMALEGQPEIIDVDTEVAVLQLTFDATYNAHLSYEDSATVVYSEGDLVYSEHRDEEVERHRKLLVEIDVSFDRKNLSGFDVMNVSLSKPSGGFGIMTKFNYDWPYK